MTASKCGLCDRPTGPINTSLVRLQVALCERCYNQPVTIRVAQDRLAHVYTFYVSSLSGSGDTYTVKRFRASMTCTCPDFVHRGQVLRVPCKHVRLVRLFARAVGGFASVPRGREVRFRLADPRHGARAARA